MVYTIVFDRYGKVEFEEVETRAEANRQFNFISEYGIGFPEFILDENNVIIRDGVQNNIICVRMPSQIGKKYDLENHRIIN